MSQFRVGLRLVVLMCSLAALVRTEEEWLDPYDMLNYDAGTKTMKKQGTKEPTTYPNVPTKRREHAEEDMDCSSQVSALKTEVEDLRKSIASISQQPTCSPVFRRFLTRFLKLIEKVGLPTDNTDSFYNAKVKVTRRGVTEIQKFLESGEIWQQGAMDDVLSQLLIDVKPLDFEAWKWRFEDVFGVEIDTVLKVFLCVLVIAAVICTQLWAVVSWFVQFKRMFAVCFLVSIVWNWFYLYKIEFAQHQSRLAKMDTAYEKCTGMKKIDWTDNLKEWYRTTWTLQDDPCNEYYKDLMVSPFLLVPPSKAFSVTITTFFTEPLKHIGQGISEFLRALLKDLPITLQLPVLITIVLSILVVMYGGVQAMFQHGIMGPLRLRDPPLPPAGAQPQLAQCQPAQPPPAQVQPAQPPPAYLMTPEPQGAGDAPLQRRRVRGANGAVRRRRVQRPRGAEAAAVAAPPRVPVETLGDEGYSQDETDSIEPSLQLSAGEPHAPGDGDSEEYEGEEVDEADEEESLRGATPRTVAHDATKQAEAEAKPSDPKPTVPRAKRQDNVTQGGRGVMTDDRNPAGLPGAAREQSFIVLPEFSSIETVCSPVQETSPTL
ncbi:chloride channel CLIC-like protein 1 [Gadus chalcogrammus]|uniref:chloride channel CLIC-like protein 1 n=1 Tax=Gadus chalcogrammus TaxID=1042646 RepID=UPI0024C4E509|nr:chloride channel CLIC-like protein 1 [Gadus chalcogrammus]